MTSRDQVIEWYVESQRFMENNMTWVEYLQYGTPQQVIEFNIRNILIHAKSFFKDDFPTELEGIEKLDLKEKILHDLCEDIVKSLKERYIKK